MPPLRRSRSAAVLTAGLLLLAPSVPAAAEAAPRAPSVDPTAPTPTTPHPGGPPLGRSPDGSVVGGDQLAGRGLILPAGAPALPTDISSRGWVVADLDSSDVLAGADPHGRYYPASALKTLTLLALHDELDPAEVVLGTFEDASVEGTKVGIVEGGRYPVQLLFLALMMQSGNDAANALARVAGGDDVALALMNEKASRVQAYDTVAGTVSGLDVEGQSSSPYDLALIMRQVLADPELVDIMATRTAVMPAVPPTYPAFQFQNGNQLLDRYPGALAGKTGFTDAARHTYVGAAERDGRTLVAALMQGEQQPVPMWEQAAALLDWGFALPDGTPPVGELVDPLAPGQALPTPATATPIGSATTTPREAPLAAATPTTEGHSRFLLAVGLGVGSALLVLAIGFRLRRG